MTPAEFTTQFRYSEDIPTRKLHESDNKYEAFEAHNSLLITETISPIIFSSLERAAKNLLIDHKKINMYVYASAEINAKCYNGIDDGYVVLLSSGLVMLLEDNELDFVIGHELGHLLFGHTKEQQANSAEGMKLSRAKELSVDRIGLVASRDIDATLRAIIKTISGLSEKYINFNISEFINQSRKFDVDASSMLGQTTHPSFLVRAKALLLFETSDKYQNLFSGDGKNILEVDKAIKREMDKHIDKSFNTKAEELKRNFNFWATCFAAIADKTLSKDEQTYIADTFGNERLNKFKMLIEGRSAQEIENLVNKKLLQASSELAEFRSVSVTEDIDEIILSLSKNFKIANLKEKFLGLFDK